MRLPAGETGELKTMEGESEMEYKFTNDNFEKEVLGADIPVFVDFYADWCGPCKMMAPIVEKLAEKYEGKLKVGKCNVDEESTIAVKYRIMSIPTMMIFINGEAKETVVGAVSQGELENLIEKNVKNA